MRRGSDAGDHHSLVRIGQRLEAIAHNGLQFCRDEFDRERYVEIQVLAMEVLTLATLGPKVTVQKDIGYMTPKIAVRGLVFRGNKLLFVRERQDGLWSVPGGWCEVGRSASENVASEVKEETGLEVKPVRLVSLLDWSRHGAGPPLRSHAYVAAFICEEVGGRLEPGLDVQDLGFFGPDEIPELSRPRASPAVVRAYFLSQTATLPRADFD